jgi:hypothetical protein
MITPDPVPAAPSAGEPQENRLLAALAHLSFISGFWLVAPIAIYVVKRKESRFVAFHALQAVLVQVVFGVVMTLGFIGFVILMAVAGGRRSDTLAMVVFALPLCGLALGLLTLFTVHAVAAFRAWRGEGWSIPLVGGLARAIMGADTGVPKGG